MTRPTRQSIFEEAARKMRAAFDDVRSSVPHRGEAGGESELILTKFLNEHLPGRFRATQGFVIDRADAVSGHVDAIVYDALHCPAYRVSDKGMLLPNDNVAAVVEVKFRLTSTRLKEALEKIRSLKVLAKSPRGLDEKGTRRASYGIVFAFESELSEESCLSIWKADISEARPIQQSTTLIVVLDKGIFSTTYCPAGEGTAPAFIEIIPAAPAGSELGLGYFPYGSRTLDGMLRFLLDHLAAFRHRVDHPGFDFATFGKIPYESVATIAEGGRLNFDA